MLNMPFINEFIIANDRYAWGHGAGDNFLGMGMLYYAIPYCLKAATCVCLGSGCGFVPKLMRQAQCDAKIAGVTWLIDADVKGNTDYYHLPKCTLLEFDIRIVKQTTQAAVSLLERIDYLHIDADHRYECVREDFDLYRRLLSNNGIVTFHDVYEDGVKRLLQEIAADGYNVITFATAAGVAMVSKQERCVTML